MSIPVHPFCARHADRIRVGEESDLDAATRRARLHLFFFAKVVSTAILGAWLLPTL
ncbi:MAG: hypothetical protein ACHREM_12215 [Polyangiales bacterium]